MDQLGEQLWEGAGHRIYQHPSDADRVIKVPRSTQIGLPYERVAADLQICRERFSQWLPKTEVEADHQSGYRVIQDKVPQARHVRPSDLLQGNIKGEVDKLMEANRSSLAIDGIGLDFIGLEGSAKCILANRRHKKNSQWDRYFMTPLLKFAVRMKHKYPNLLFPKESLNWWEADELYPEISNLIIETRDGTDHLHIIDLSLVHTRSNSMKEKIRSAVLQWWNRKYLKKNFDLDL